MYLNSSTIFSRDAVHVSVALGFIPLHFSSVIDSPFNLSTQETNRFLDDGHPWQGPQIGSSLIDNFRQPNWFLMTNDAFSLVELAVRVRQPRRSPSCCHSHTPPLSSLTQSSHVDAAHVPSNSSDGITAEACHS